MVRTGKFNVARSVLQTHEVLYHVAHPHHAKSKTAVCIAYFMIAAIAQTCLVTTNRQRLSQTVQTFDGSSLYQTTDGSNLLICKLYVLN